MKIASLIEFLDAAADTKYCNGPFEERGGIMIVAPPGSFKSTIIEAALEGHADGLPLSDLNVKDWLRMKDDFKNGRYKTLGFGEFEKLYQRHSSTAANLEGIIKQLTGEGAVGGPGTDSRMPTIKARALILGGITPDCFERRFADWQKSGFARRFIWLVFSVFNQDKILESIRKWEKLDFGNVTMRPANRIIKVSLDEGESKKIEKMMRHQVSTYGTGYVLMKKIVAVLRWKHEKNPKHVDEILEEIAPCLTRNGGSLIL